MKSIANCSVRHSETKVRGQKLPREVDKNRNSIPNINQYMTSKECQNPVFHVLLVFMLRLVSSHYYRYISNDISSTGPLIRYLQCHGGNVMREFNLKMNFKRIDNITTSSKAQQTSPRFMRYIYILCVHISCPSCYRSPQYYVQCRRHFDASCLPLTVTQSPGWSKREIYLLKRLVNGWFYDIGEWRQSVMIIASSESYWNVTDSPT